MIDLSFLGEGREAELKRRVLSEYFFIIDDSSQTNKQLFLENLNTFVPDLIQKGISESDIAKIKRQVTRVKVEPKSTQKIMVRLLDSFLTEPWKKDPYTFVREAREYLKNRMLNGYYPQRPDFLQFSDRGWLSNNDLLFLCESLGMKKVAFLTHYQIGPHHTFIMSVEGALSGLVGKIKQLLRGEFRGITRVYDPIKNDIQTIRTKRIIQEEPKGAAGLYLVTLSKDLEFDYLQQAERHRKYTRAQFLSDIEYKVNESFVRRIGATQRNAYDCGPLVVYAALQSKH